MATIPASARDHRPSVNFSPLGMLLTLFIGLLVAITVGLASYALKTVLSFSVPILVPAAMGFVVGLAIRRLGSTIGRCRNQVLAVTVAVVAGMAAWGTEHIVDYSRFRLDAYGTILAQYPSAAPDRINYVVDEWLMEQTGQHGFIGFMLLKATSNSMKVTTTSLGYGGPINSFVLDGLGLVLYWLSALLISAGVAGRMNWVYPKAPYCGKCNAWRRFETPIFGTASGAPEAIEHFASRDIPGAVAALRKSPDGNIARLEVEYCPVCYDSIRAQLVVVEDTGARTWLEKTVWSDRLEPQHVRSILELAR